MADRIRTLSHRHNPRSRSRNPSPGKYNRTRLGGPEQLRLQKGGLAPEGENTPVSETRGRREINQHFKHPTSRREDTKGDHLPCQISTFPQSTLPPLTSGSGVLRRKVPCLLEERLPPKQRSGAPSEVPTRKQWARRGWGECLREASTEARCWDPESLGGRGEGWRVCRLIPLHPGNVLSSTGLGTS